QAILQKPTTTRFDTRTTVKATPSAPSSPTPPAATTSDQPDKTQATTQPLATDTSAPSTPAPPFSDQTERARFTWKPHYIWLIVAFLVLLAALAWLLAPKSPTIQMVQMSPRAGAVLQAPGQTSTPGWVLSVDPEGHVLLAPQVRTDLHPDQSVQLWTQEPSSTEIRSLGLINPNQPVTIPAEIIGQVHVGQIFEMTIEPKEGSAEPSSSVLFIGRVVNFGEYQAPVQETPTT
ncbi:MAG: anti-sigma factor, partial [Alcaligenaceae bacterium]|nr:anti-sigma factor [Alcaligenaceae bacterium]